MEGDISEELEKDFDPCFRNDNMANVVKKSHERRLIKLDLKRSCISAQGVLFFSQGRWDYLIELRICRKLDNCNRIENKGCKYLTRAYLPNIEKIYIANQDIGRSGIVHLAKGQWPKLKHLQVYTGIRFSIGDEMQAFQLLKSFLQWYKNPAKFWDSYRRLKWYKGYTCLWQVQK